MELRNAKRSLPFVHLYQMARVALECYISNMKKTLLFHTSDAKEGKK